jgi:hypothetical protein
MWIDTTAKQTQIKHYYFSALFFITSIITYFYVEDKKIWIMLGFISCLQFCEKITIHPNEKTSFYTSYYLAPAISSVFNLQTILIISAFSFFLTIFISQKPIRQRIIDFIIKLSTFMFCASICYTTTFINNNSFTNTTKTYLIIIIYSVATITTAYAHQLINVVFGRTYEWKSLAKIAQGVVISCSIIAGITFNKVGNANAEYFLGVVIFYIPVISLWQSINRYMESKHTFIQTIDAISKAPELAEYIPMGHSQRVKNMALQIAKKLGLPLDVREDLAIACLLCDVSVNILEKNMNDTNYNWDNISKESAVMLENTTKFKNVQWIIQHYNDSCINGESKTRLKLAAEALSISKEWDKEMLENNDEVSTLNKLALEPIGKYNTEMLNIIAKLKGITYMPSNS